MVRHILYHLFLLCCVVVGVRASEENHESVACVGGSFIGNAPTIPSNSARFSFKNKSNRPVFLILADGERAQNGSVEWVGKEHASHYGVILNQALVMPNVEINFVIKHNLSQVTLYLWEGNGINSVRKFDVDVLDQLGISIAKKQFKINPTAIFRFSPGDNESVNLKWKFGQLLPRSKKKKFGRRGYVNNINKNQIRQLDFGQNDDSAQLSNFTNSSLRRSGLID